MGLEAVTNLADLVPTNPTPGDAKSQGDDHIRNTKIALLNAFAGFLGSVLVTGTDGGNTNAYTITPSTAQQVPAYTSRMGIVFSPTAANTGASTVNVSALGAKPLRAIDGAELVQGDLLVGAVYMATYTGAEFRLTGPTKNYIDQKAFLTSLPAQFGNGGKPLMTDGVSATWANPPSVNLHMNNNFGGF